MSIAIIHSLEQEKDNNQLGETLKSLDARFHVTSFHRSKQRDL